MAQRPKIVGYGLCTAGEPYLEQTLQEFERLCDETIILFNNATPQEKELVKKYGFHTVEDNTEWGKYQWKIKERFVTEHVAKLNPDLCVCLDMDEVFDKHLTKEGLYDLFNTPFKAFYFHIVNLWDDGYSPERSFWNIRAWKWNKTLGTKYPQKNLHCGLAPEWTWVHGFYAPYLLKHYGLKDKKRREKKAERYDKYDPQAKYMAKEYYQSLRSSPEVEPFDEDEKHQEIVDYVHKYKQTYTPPMEKEEDLIIIETKSGETAYVSKDKQIDYERQGCKIVGPYKEVEDTLDEILDAPQHTPQTTPEEIFKCGECSKEFGTGKQLHAHKLGAHKKIWNYGRK